MNVYNAVEAVPWQERVVVLGNLDGVHKGHQQLIKSGRRLADQYRRELMVVTFYPQFQAMRDADFRYLTSQWVKMKIFERLGVESVLALPFSPQVARMAPEDFVQRWLIADLGARHIVAGFNYTFGHKGAGTVDALCSLAQERNVAVEIVPPVYVGEEVVNSTLIRQTLRDGDIAKVRRLLGYPFVLDGIVVHGHQLGRTIGIPTANIRVDKQVALPPTGVYAAWVFRAGQVYQGVLNVGSRPTVDNGSDTSVEVHILDFSQEIYAEHISVGICCRLRGETKFAGLEELKQQINRDMEKTREFFATSNK